MRWHAGWALHGTITSERVRAETIAQGGARSRAIRNAADMCWFNPVLCELIRFGVVAPREAAIPFLDLAKDIVAHLLKLTPGALSDSLNLDHGEDAEINRLANADAGKAV